MERAKGFEPSTQTLEIPSIQALPSASNSDYTQIRAQIASSLDPELAQVVDAWSSLSQPLKAAILAIVGTTKKGGVQ
jgi:hypothetical protein